MLNSATPHPRPAPPPAPGLRLPRWVRILLQPAASEDPAPPPALLAEHHDPPQGVTCRCYPR